MESEILGIGYKIRISRNRDVSDTVRAFCVNKDGVEKYQIETIIIKYII